MPKAKKPKTKRVIKLHLSIGFTTCREDTEELPDDWDAMSPKEQEAYLDDVAGDFRDNYVEYSASIEEVPD
jgi:hypothetical protein